MNKYQTFVFDQLYGECTYEKLLFILKCINKCRSYESALKKAQKLLQGV